MRLAGTYVRDGKIYATLLGERVEGEQDNGKVKNSIFIFHFLILNAFCDENMAIINAQCVFLFCFL